MVLDRRVWLGLAIAVFLTIQVWFFASYGFIGGGDDRPADCNGGAPTSSKACFR